MFDWFLNTILTVVFIVNANITVEEITAKILISKPQDCSPDSSRYPLYVFRHNIEKNSSSKEPNKQSNQSLELDFALNL